MKKEAAGNGKKVVDLVSQDKDWRGVISNELRCAEGWEKDWGFLADDTNVEKTLTKNEKIQALEEKLKKMEGIQITSSAKRVFKGGEIDFKINSYNKKKNPDLLPQSRRPDNISKAHAHLKEKLGDDYKTRPHDNFLPSK